MTDAMLTQVKDLLHKVSSDVQEMGDSTSDQLENVLAIMDDLAANILAVQAVVSAIARERAVDKEKIKDWLRENTDPDGDGANKAYTLAEYLVDPESSTKKEG